MKDLFNKEFVVKRKLIGIVYEVVVEAILWTTLVYIVLKDYGTEIIETVKVINEHNNGFECFMLMLPIFLIMLTTFKIGYYMTSDKRKDKKKK